MVLHIQSSVIKITQRKPKAQDVHGPLLTRSAQPLPTSFNRIDESNRSAENEEMIIKFNTAYNIAKEELPFTKFISQIMLMKMNGLNVNPTYSNDTACAQFVSYSRHTQGKDR